MASAPSGSQGGSLGGMHKMAFALGFELTTLARQTAPAGHMPSLPRASTLQNSPKDPPRICFASLGARINKPKLAQNLSIQPYQGSAQ